MILWAVKDFDGTEWGMQPQNIHLFIPRRKMAALEEMQHFWCPEEDDHGQIRDDDDDQASVQKHFETLVEEEREERGAIQQSW